MNLLITGCRSGFGLLAAVTAARAGHTVFAGLRDLSTADELRAAADGLEVHPVQLDVTDADQRAAVVAEIEALPGGIGGLVNNAGIALGGPLEEVAEDELRRVFEVNVFSVWALTNAVLPGMRRRRRGHIVTVSSMAGRMATPCLGAYAGTKHAISGMTEALRAEVRDFGVQVSLVEPGPYKTDIFSRNRGVARQAGRPDSPYAAFVEKLDRLAKKVADGAGDPQEVADRIVALLADPRPPLRNPMGGASTRVRLLARWALPPGAYEAVIRQAIERG